MKAPTTLRMPAIGLGLFCLTILLPATVVIYAQDVAPSSLANSMLTVTVTGGRAPFATNGSVRLFTSVTGTNYLALGPGPLSAGNYTYAKTGPAAGTVTLADTAAGLPVSLELLFAATNTGTLALTNATGFQTGSFVAAPYVDASPPALFLPQLTNGQFQSYLSGQPGFVYSVETSTDLAHLQPWAEILLTDLTTKITDTVGGTGRFYLASLKATAFAPEDLTNKTFNLTIAQGAAPLATNGICQWLADTNDDGYQVIGGPGTTNSSGHYTYTRTGPNSGLISCQDSLASSVNQQLVFTSPQSGWFYLTNAAGFEAGTFTLADGPVPFLGNAHFTLDTAHAGSLDFAADGSPGRLSVTNAAGWIWTLSFPADALLIPRTIGMTPFASVDASASLLPMAAGVQLSPEGLQFSAGITLTVTPPAPLGPHAALLMADADGSNLHFVSTNVSKSQSTTLFHFSSVAATDPSQQQWDDFLNQHLPQALANYSNAVSNARGLKRLVVIPPEPPDYDWKCNPGDKAVEDARVDIYYQALFARETEALTRLLNAAKELEWLTVEVTPDVFSVAREVIETVMYRKVDSLFGTYSGNPNKCMAVTYVALNVSRWDEFMVGTGRPDWLQQIQSWGQRVVDYYFDQLRNQHMYSKASALPRVEATIELLGADIDMEAFQNRLAAALSFQLNWDINFTQTQGSADTTLDIATVEAKGLVNLQGWQMPQYAQKSFDFVPGSCSWSEVGNAGSHTFTFVGPTSTHIMFACLNLDTCASSPRVGIAPGPLAFESWVRDDGQQENDQEWLALGYSNLLRFGQGIPNYDGNYFQFPLADGQAEMVNQTIQVQANNGQSSSASWTLTGTIQLDLQHTPK